MAQKKAKGLHVAIIMDGNGRWAEQQGQDRTVGHIAGAEVVQPIVEHVSQIGISTLTLWGFSTDNYKRPDNEVNALMGLFEEFIVKKGMSLHDKNVRVTFIGRRYELPSELQSVMKGLEEQTRDNSGPHLQVALNYGGREEILDAVREIAKQGVVPSEEYFSELLYTSGVPDPDLIIRTGREMRLSGFMSWQSKHAELAFPPVLWPDFTTDLLDEILADYHQRDRRRGGL